VIPCLQIVLLISALNDNIIDGTRNLLLGFDFGDNIDVTSAVVDNTVDTFVKAFSDNGVSITNGTGTMSSPGPLRLWSTVVVVLLLLKAALLLSFSTVQLWLSIVNLFSLLEVALFLYFCFFSWL